MRILFTAALAAVLLPTAASAQDAPLAGRVDRLEREMRAVQRKVFPGGAGLTIEPQITAPQTPVDAPGTPATDAVADLNARVSALETSVRSVTGQAEQATYRVAQLEEAFAAYRRTTDARLKALEGGGSAVPAAGVSSAAVAASGDTATVDDRPAVARPTAAARPAGNAEGTAAIERPATGDAAEDGYLYGFRLWNAKRYPEAIAELKTVADKHPKHRRASYAQNLIGRAYLDDGKPSLASLAFYDSYKKWPDGERAHESLFYLAKSLERLKKPAGDVCKVYDELTQVYGSKIGASMKADMARGRAAQNCR
jgi:TolA-binding protein